MKILVLAGGLSTEREVSLSSGSLICAALRRRGHRARMLDVYEGVEIPEGADLDAMFDVDCAEVRTVGDRVPDLEAVRARMGGQRELIGQGVIALCREADVVFLALHGAMGENGQLQATLDNFGIRHYTGSGYVGSLLAMDKDLSKQILRGAGVDTPDWILCRTDEDAYGSVMEQIGLPCVVKPLSGGSSVGVSVVESESELSEALAQASVYECTVLVEKKICGRELTCGMLDGVVLPPVEIIPKSGFYDYRNKYLAGATTEICPAPIGAEATEALAAVTRKAFGALRLEGYARLDYIMDGEGRFWCLEANTLPGMTPTSLLPQEAAAVGIDYDGLCEKLAYMAYEKGRE